MKSIKVIINLLFILIIVMLGLGSYFFYLNHQAVKDLNNKVQEINEQNNKEEQKEEKTKSTLFNEEKTLEDICSNKSGICTENLGNFTIGEKDYSFKIHYNMDDIFNSEYDASNNKNENLANYIMLGDKKIDLSDGMTSLDKIVKLSDNYIAIGTDSISGGNYTIKIYDENLNLVKNYNSLHNNNTSTSDYFKVLDNSFYRYECDTTNSNSSGDGQILKKYKVSINGNNFNEELISSNKEFCSSQT